MNISEAARLSGLSSKQIRDYEKNGLLPPAERSGSGYRRYSGDDVATLRFIRHARDVGFSLKQIDRLLQLQRDPQRNSRDVKRITAEHIQELAEKISELQRMAATLQRWHDCCDGSDRPDCPILNGLAAEGSIGESESAAGRQAGCCAAG